MKKSRSKRKRYRNTQKNYYKNGEIETISKSNNIEKNFGSEGENGRNSDGLRNKQDKTLRLEYVKIDISIIIAVMGFILTNQSNKIYTKQKEIQEKL